MVSCATGDSLFAACAASSSGGCITRRRQGFHAYSQLGTCLGRGSLIDPGCWIPPGGRRLFLGQQFWAAAFSLLAPCRLAEDVFCGAGRGSMCTVGSEHVAEGG